MDQKLSNLESNLKIARLDKNKDQIIIKEIVENLRQSKHNLNTARDNVRRSKQQQTLAERELESNKSYNRGLTTEIWSRTLKERELKKQISLWNRKLTKQSQVIENLTGQVKESQNDRQIIENDMDMLKEEKLSILEQFKQTENELQDQRNLTQKYETTLKTYQIKLNKERNLIYDLRKNVNKLKNQKNYSTLLKKRLEQQILDQRTQIRKLNDELKDLSIKLEEKPFLNLDLGLNVKTKIDKSKPKVVKHIYPPVYSLSGLPIIYEDEEMPSKVYKPNEPMDASEVYSPLRIVQTMIEKPLKILNLKKDPENSTKTKEVKKEIEKNENKNNWFFKKESKIEIKPKHHFLEKLGIQDFSTFWGD